ncbi:MAG TPA: uroporphyrinogen-III synthase [Candidatus Thermoplasmatota archaeon]|nr:uroporphyrinogen-III synthase [Candidatus Thermoplasmatota archaeon]
MLAILRPRERMAEAVRLAQDLGFEPVAAPMLEVQALGGEAFEALVQALVEERAAWVCFSSDHAVKAAWQKASDAGRDLAMLLVGVRVAAVGPATQDALRARGVEAVMPDEHSSAGLAKLLAREDVGGKRVALVRSDRGSEELPLALRATGAEVLEVPVYSLRMPSDPEEGRALVRRAAAGEVQAFAFSSSLTARHFLDLARAEGLETRVRDALARGVVGAIGKPTQATLAELGVRCDAVAAEARFETLLQDMRAKLEARA